MNSIKPATPVRLFCVHSVGSASVNISKIFVSRLFPQVHFIYYILKLLNFFFLLLFLIICLLTETRAGITLYIPTAHRRLHFVPPKWQWQ